MLKFAVSAATAPRFADFAAQAEAIEIDRMAEHLIAARLDLGDDLAALDALRAAPWVPGLHTCRGEPGSAAARAFDPATVEALGRRAITAARARGAA